MCQLFNKCLHLRVCDLRTQLPLLEDHQFVVELLLLGYRSALLQYLFRLQLDKLFFLDHLLFEITKQTHLVVSQLLKHGDFEFEFVYCVVRFFKLLLQALAF